MFTCLFTFILIIKINQGLFRRPYSGTNHPEWLPNLEGPIIVINENILAFTHIHSQQSALIRVLKPILVLWKLPTTHSRFLLLKAFIAPSSLMVIAIKDHNTISSFKTQLQRETLASESLTPTRVVTLQLTWIMQHNNSQTKTNMFGNIS